MTLGVFGPTLTTRPVTAAGNERTLPTGTDAAEGPPSHQSSTSHGTTSPARVGRGLVVRAWGEQSREVLRAE
jgi:hypothetical protein